MVRPDKVEGILVDLKENLRKLRKLAALPAQEFFADFTKVESAKHLFQVSVECCLDVSNHIIVSERFRAPKSYAESFEILSEEGIVPKPFSQTLRRMAQFRNRLVHLYWEVDEEVIYEILQNHLDDFETFTKYVLHYMTSHK